MILQMTEQGFCAAVFHRYPKFPAVALSFRILFLLKNFSFNVWQLLALVFATGFTTSSCAQGIPNGSFEDWTFNGSWEDPVGWGTPNGTTFIMGFTTVTKAVLGVTGSYSVKLSTRSQGNQTIPGVIATGSVDVFAGIFKGGFPVTDSMKYLTGYYRFLNDTLAAGKDSGLFISYLWKWNTAMGRRDTVAQLRFTAPAVSSFQAFAAPYQYLLNSKPDSAIIIIASTRDLKAPKPSGSLWIDQLDFSNTIGLMETAPFPFSVFPNPASQQIHFQGGSGIFPAYVFLYRASGELAERKLLPQNEMATGHLPEGLYFYALHPVAGGRPVLGKLMILR
ncbi:MAG: hypothetical protein RMK52_05870 [Chitinophagales bacterium]|nr:hypothetical protein [Chitinophagales bacterium]